MPDASKLSAEIGVRLRAARERAGLSQEELADRIGRHADSISLVERGRTLPIVSTLLNMCEALGVDVPELLPVQPLKRSRTRMRLEAEIAEALRALPDNRLGHVLEQIKLLGRLK